MSSGERGVEGVNGGGFKRQLFVEKWRVSTISTCLLAL